MQKLSDLYSIEYSTKINALLIQFDACNMLQKSWGRGTFTTVLNLFSLLTTFSEDLGTDYTKSLSFESDIDVSDHSTVFYFQ